jgi:hypothetical protein
LVGYLGVRWRPLVREFFDQYTRVRHGDGSVWITSAEDAHQRLRTTLWRTNR